MLVIALRPRWRQLVSDLSPAEIIAIKSPQIFARAVQWAIRAPAKHKSYSSIRWDTWICKRGLASVPTQPRASQDQRSAKVSPPKSISYNHIFKYGRSLRPKVKGTMWMPLGECPIALAAVPWKFLRLALYTPRTVVGIWWWLERILSPNYPNFPFEILA